MYAHFRDATLELRDTSVETAQFICLSNHASHNGRECSPEIDQAQPA
jgi:hypothetical protein